MPYFTCFCKLHNISENWTVSIIKCNRPTNLYSFYSTLTRILNPRDASPFSIKTVISKSKLINYKTKNTLNVFKTSGILIIESWFIEDKKRYSKLRRQMSLVGSGKILSRRSLVSAVLFITAQNLQKLKYLGPISMLKDYDHPLEI